VYDLNQPDQPHPGASHLGSLTAVDSPAEFGARLAAITPDLFVTKILLAMNVVIFLAMIVSGVNPLQPTIDNLIHWGADFGPKTITNGEWWRVLMSMFLHIGILHLSFNMFVLWQVGPFVERLLGNLGFITVYLVSGLAGAFVSLAWNPYVVSAGASGAIFGLYGALLGFLLRGRDSVPSEVLSPLIKNALIFIAFNAVYGFMRSGTDVAAHVGGLSAGFVCGLIVSVPLTVDPLPQRGLRNATVALGAAALFIGIAAKLPRPVDLQAEIITFGVVEKSVLSSFNGAIKQAQMEHWKDGQMADEVEKHVIPPWATEHVRFTRFKSVTGPPQRVISAVLQYMEARQQAWSLLVLGLRQHNVVLVQRAMQLQREAKLSIQPVDQQGP
jgi:rhomboid protease GluP